MTKDSDALNFAEGTHSFGTGDENPPRVFISYSQVDKQFVNRLLTDLIRANVPVWVDIQRLEIGDSITEGIASGIECAEFFAIVLSPASVASRWVRTELSAALTSEVGREKTFVLPVLYQQCEIPLLLRDKRFADFRESYDEGFNELLRVLFPAPRVLPETILAGEEKALSDGDRSYSTWREDLTAVTEENLDNDDVLGLYEATEVPLPKVTAPTLTNLLNELIRVSVRDHRVVRLLDAANDLAERKRRAHRESKEISVSIPHRTALAGSESKPFDDWIPRALPDGTIDLASPVVDTVSPVVVFRTTGERFRVRLPLSLQCSTAAKRIVGQLFLQELPVHRRSLYLDGSTFALTLGTRSYASETLTEAGIADGDEITIRSWPNYPWVHDANVAHSILASARVSFEKDAVYRLYSHVRALTRRRLAFRSMTVAGP